MLETLHTGDIPHFQVGNLKSHNWDILLDLWNKSSIAKNYLRLYKDSLDWHIEEFSPEGKGFHMTRNLLSKDRRTIVDDYGLLGLSLINLQDKSVIITEGVSDYFTAKLLCPNRNVLGITTLGGSAKAKVILLNLFDSFLICADNDSTGLTNAHRWKRFLTNYNKSVSIFTPSSSYKDITDNFIFNLKLNQ